MKQLVVAAEFYGNSFPILRGRLLKKKYLKNIVRKSKGFPILRGRLLKKARIEAREMFREVSNP